MSKELSLVEMDAFTLVAVAIKDRARIKLVGSQLESMVPDEEAAQWLISAFRNNQCEPWLAAYLLGCIGHRVGYATVKSILLSNVRSSAHSYAGVAMAKILGTEAYDDLRRIVFSEQPRKVRQGAAYGMAKTSSPRLLDDLVAACDEQRLSRNDVSWHAAKCNPTDDWLLAHIQADNVDHLKLACAVIEWMVSPNYTHRQPGISVAKSVQILLNDQSFSINPIRRANLLAWINAT